MDLRHAHIQVSDMSKSRHFYESFFEFEEDIVCSENEVFLKNKKGFVLGLDKVEKPEILPKWFHFGFSCESKKESERINSLLMDAQCDIARELTTFENGDMNLYVNDPDGTSLEIYFNV